MASLKTVTPTPVTRTQGGEEVLIADTVVVTQLDKVIGWARKYSLFPYPFATACCAMEFMALSLTPYDIDRFGALLPRFSPRQADLLMVIGTVTCRQAPILKKRIMLNTLIEAGLVKAAPQSIVQMKPETNSWIRDHLK